MIVILSAANGYPLSRVLHLQLRSNNKCRSFASLRMTGVALRMTGVALRMTAVLILAGCGGTTPVSTTPTPTPTRPAFTGPRLVPQPASLVANAGDPFVVSRTTAIVVDAGNAEAARSAELLAAIIRPSTALPIPVTTNDSPNSITLHTDASRTSLGDEGYELTSTNSGVRIVAAQNAGLYRATQTLRQLLPYNVESHMNINSPRWTVPAVTIVDQPRFPWRGAMLDVSRHFFTVKEVKQFIDLLALYKMNTLHLHLSDDQGWRIEIKSRPQLVAMGSVTQVGGGEGGFYTQADYGEIIRYAGDRFITVVPEIDMPAHINAALVSHPQLSCGKRPAALYTGTEVGFSAFCVDSAGTYALMDDIVREIAAITPGKWFHIGGDEVQALTPAQYKAFIERAQDIVHKYGKQMVGWDEIHKASLTPTSVVQAWANDSLASAVRNGGKILLSPAKRMYLDMKYTASTELGLRWAALIELRDAYDWDPATYMKGVSERDILGVEAPLWSETVRNITAAQFLVMPRLPAIAELGWTPQGARSWEEFRQRIAGHAPRWHLMGVNYYQSPQVNWESGTAPRTTLVP